MRCLKTSSNPFGIPRFVYLWEQLNARKPGAHLDFGTHDGSVLVKLISTKVITSGVGTDANSQVTQNSLPTMPDGVTLRLVRKGEALPFAKECFDSASILGVLEHIYDQKRVLRELFRVLRPGGILVIEVPKKHVFSWLDLGNFKFRFPRLHRKWYEHKYGTEEYVSRYIDHPDGLFGDVEKEKGWHQHFSEDELSSLLKSCGFKVLDVDGYGLFQRPLLAINYIFPFLESAVTTIRKKDNEAFKSMSLMMTASKSSD